MITVGILGGTGYMGGEALRVLLEHPEFEVQWITSRSDVSVPSDGDHAGAPQARRGRR